MPALPGCTRPWLSEGPHRHLHGRCQCQCDAPLGRAGPIAGDQSDLDRHPSGLGDPFVLDIATTVTSHGTIKVLAQAGEQMPEGWVVGLKGDPSSIRTAPMRVT